ncbi:MAG: hypothetical protein JSW71_17115 [Gemmatimonadota bacterium]|nr:MAG: hypothetical protein JSW71_17115 [Gemmatimonadota bacterium]
MANQNLRRCPLCAEWIQPTAIVCRYCQRAAGGALGPAERTRLEEYYEGLSDEYLAKAFAAGPEGYREADVWEIVRKAYLERGLGPGELPGSGLAGRRVSEPVDGGSSPGPGVNCSNHTAVQATRSCMYCGSPICDTCAFEFPGPVYLCPACAIRPPEGLPGSGLDERRASERVDGGRVPGPGVSCSNHAAVQATRSCMYCGSPICDTCAFEFPGPTYLCPACATRPPEVLTPRRRHYLIGSYVSASIATLFLAILVSGLPFDPSQTVEESDAIAGLLTLMILAGSITGISLGAMARAPGGASPGVVQAARIWNIVLLIGFILLVIAGIFAA